jgi:PKD repeat protein
MNKSKAGFLILPFVALASASHASICETVIMTVGVGSGVDSMVSTGGSATGGSHGAGPGYDDDSYVNHWEGYNSHVGMKSVEIGKRKTSPKSWKGEGSEIWPVDDIPGDKDFRVKVKKKGNIWPQTGETCVEIWFTHNKYFTDKDLFLGSKCKNLFESGYDDKYYESFFVKNVNIPNEMEAGKNYYFSARIIYPNGINPSSSNNSDEYVKVEIADFSSGFEMNKFSEAIPVTVQFTNESNVVHGTITYHWDFGDGYTSTAENPSHVYNQVGSYKVILTTTSNWDDIKTSTTTITATKPLPVDTDGDGVMDSDEQGDTDGDGVQDSQESWLVDSDNDGVNDQLDSENTNAANDSDADGYTNEEEVVAGTDPLNPSSFPVSSEDDCQETTETATNGGYGWNPVQGISCVPESQDFCHETAQTVTNGGWGWNPYKEEGCEWSDEVSNFRRADVNDDGVISGIDKDLLFEKSTGTNPVGWVEANPVGIVGDTNCDGNVSTTDAMLLNQYLLAIDVVGGTSWCATSSNFEGNSEDDCQETAETATNGGYGWNPVQEISCVPESQDFCHETAQTATNGGWGWNPYTEAGCEWSGDSTNGNNLIANANFSNGFANWIDASYNISSGNVDIFDERAVVTIYDNPDNGDAKLFHDEVSVTAGNYTFGATITNDVAVTAMLLLKKTDGSEDWSWAGVITPSATEQTVTFNKTISADVTTARVIMSIKDIGTLGIDDYFLIKE